MQLECDTQKLKSFEAHLNNIHVNPLVCTVEHCKHRKPFRANHDLQRRIATAHNPYAKYVCPYESCADRRRGFSLKDKWLSHLREHHDTEWCPFTHCPLRQEHPPPHSQSTSKHIGKAHSNLECALKSCEGKISRFSETQLLEHLEIILYGLSISFMRCPCATTKSAGNNLLAARLKERLRSNQFMANLYIW